MVPISSKGTTVYLTIVTLVSESDGISPPDAAEIQDVISRLAASMVDLQHVRVSTGPGKIDIVLFCGATSAASAEAASVALCQKGCDVSPVLRGWRVKLPSGRL